jgi:hypothetical protein
VDGSSRSHSPKRDSHQSRASRRQPSGQSHGIQLSESDGEDVPTSKPRSKRSSKRTGIEDEANKEAREKRSSRKHREAKSAMADGSASSLEGSGTKLRFAEAGGTMAEGSEKDNKLSDNSRNRDRKDGRRMSDDSKRKDGRRMSDDSKNRELRAEGRRMSEESRRDREVRRHPEAKRRARRIITDKSNRDKEGRRMKDDSDVARRRRRNDQDADLKKERRERVMRSKDAHIPPPSHSHSNDEAEANDYPPSHGPREGPNDMASAEPRHSRANRRTHRSPLDLPPPAESHADDDVGTTTWQRGALVQETSWHRPGQKRQPRRSHVADSIGASSRLANSPTTAPRRQAGRLNRGANVRQSQMLHMVQLQADGADHSEEIDQLSEIEEAQLDGEEEESPAERDQGMSNSDHQHSHMRSLGKAAVKASAVVAKTSASAATSVAKSSAKVAGKAATSGAKAAGKATMSGAKAAGKAVKGVLGLGRKKKKQYADPESAAAGLIMDDLQDSGGHLDLRDTDEEFGHDSSGDHL